MICGGHDPLLSCILYMAYNIYLSTENSYIIMYLYIHYSSDYAISVAFLAIKRKPNRTQQFQ